MTQQIVPTNLDPMGHEQITVATVKSLTVPAGAKFAYLQAQTGPIRWLDSGTAPTSTLGTLLIVGNPPWLYEGDLYAIQFIDDGATSGTLNVSYLGYRGSA